MATQGRTRIRRRAFRLFLVAAYALLATLTWQLGLVELVEHHDEAAQECPDDEGSCDCGPNCHCCLMCAHQVVPAIAPAAPQMLAAPVAFVELTLVPELLGPPSVDHSPPPKVPKHLA